ncbi:hypothetical protein [Achromobacter ruhlandii]|uniref:hypothetical protein n=1 Tax=Achromobacter ruhlandii TaxID=72557 RepID=UPI001EEEB80B|nr:hypothetical protein [Achromobacter ruhlandii]
MNENNAAQAAEQEIREAFELTYAADADDPACASDLSHFTNGWRACVMSQVRAPVADTLPLEAALHVLVDKIVPGLDTGDLVHDAGRASAMLSGIMASAPVAGEARTEGGDPASPRDDSDRTYDKPIGYLPVYELGRLHSGHSANLRSAKFGPSALDGDVPVYLDPPKADAAPQASAEYERGHADGWAAGWDQAIKQPQADKDGGGDA